MSLTLKIQIVRTNTLKAIKFAPTMSVSEACATIQEKTSEGGEDHGLFQPAGEAKRGARWLRMDRTLQYYDLKTNDTLEFKKKHRPLKVKLLDDTVKTMIVDDSMSVEQLVEIVGKKMNIKNFEEFSLQTENAQAGILPILIYSFHCNLTCGRC
jgi:talin